MCEPGDKILSLDLNHGGHLSHGHPANFTGQLYEVEQYEVDPETGYLDYDDLADHAAEFDPDIIVSGYSAYPREIEWERIQDAADDVDALHLADIAHITGLVAAGVHPSPVGIADFVTGSTHKTIRSGRGGIVMCDEQYADDIDAAVFPGGQGGPLMHNIAGKAVGFKGSPRASVRRLRRADGRECESARREPLRERPLAGLGGHRQPPRARRPAREPPRHDRRRRRGGARGGWHRPQRKHGTRRDPLAVQPERDPRRHAGADHARLRRGRLPHGRRPDRPRH